MEQWWVTNSVKRLGKIQGDDDDMTIYHTVSATAWQVCHFSHYLVGWIFYSEVTHTPLVRFLSLEWYWLWFFKANITKLRSAYGMSRPSVVCCLSVTLVHATQRVELLANIFAPNSPGTRTLCIKILRKFTRGSRGSCKVKQEDMKNWRFSTI